MNIQSKDKRKAVLEATLSLVAKQGLHNTPMSQVSKQAGVSAGAIYHYFDSKEALINELYLAVKLEASQASFCGVTNSQPFEARFMQMWANTYSYFAERPVEMSFIEQCANSPLITAASKQAADQFHRTAFAFIQEGIDQGLLKPLDITLTLSLIYGAMLSLIKLRHEGKRVTEADQNAAALFCWHGIIIK